MYKICTLYKTHLYTVLVVYLPGPSLYRNLTLYLKMSFLSNNMENLN